MESDSTVRQSLQEIAQLLLAIHEKYIQSSENQEILGNLVSFIKCIGLEHKICLLDIEYYRRKVMSADAFHSEMLGYRGMGYEAFYGWLKELAAHYYQHDSLSLVKNEKKSFHMLLTNYIVPFASNSHDKLGRIDAIDETRMWLANIDHRTLETLVEYKELLKLWFMSMLIQVMHDITSLLLH